jgi:Xaa-Pro aminopeptidase
MKPDDLDPAHFSRVHGARRRRLAQAMQEGVAVIPTAPERIRNRDTHYPYRYDSHFYYLTGFAEPEAVLVLVAGAQPRSLLFCREKNEERETWDGFRFGPKGAQERYAFDEAYPIAELDADQGCWGPSLYYLNGPTPPGMRAPWSG